MVLVDTSVWIDFFNGVESIQTNKLDYALINEEIILLDIILVEILQGFNSDKDFDRALKALNSLSCFNLGNKSNAIKAARNFRFLRGHGITIRKTIDMLIGTWCIEKQVPLLHNVKDFDRIAIKLPLKMYA